MNQKRYLVYAVFGTNSTKREFETLEECFKFLKYSIKKYREIFDRKEKKQINANETLQNTRD